MFNCPKSPRGKKDISPKTKTILSNKSKIKRYLRRVGWGNINPILCDNVIKRPRIARPIVKPFIKMYLKVQRWCNAVIAVKLVTVLVDYRSGIKPETKPPYVTTGKPELCLGNIIPRTHNHVNSCGTAGVTSR